MISVLTNPGVPYPTCEDCFSPDEPYPEYQHGHTARTANHAYRMVRNCLAQAGLDSANFGSKNWNPLGAYVKEGDRVFTLVNFVQDTLRGDHVKTIEGKCTHGSVLRAILDYLLIAVGRDGHVSFGNAPLQNCSWERVLEQTGAARVLEFYDARGLSVNAYDLRVLVSERNAVGAPRRYLLRDDSACVEVDLGESSLLEGLYGDHAPEFRVTNYDPARTRARHSRGRHIYVLNKKILDADVILSVPKLKTHEKVGMTGALKGCVGAIGHKDCLAHHRFGSPPRNGDEYPDDRFGLLGRASAFHDWVNGRKPTSLGLSLRSLERVVQAGIRRVTPITAGAWCGNDTAWRMSLDIARIIGHFRDGRMSSAQVRRHIAVVDGIVGGEGRGPLRPIPVNSGAVVFADNPVAADYVGALLMGYDPLKLPIIREAASLESYALISTLDTNAILNGRSVSLTQLPPARSMPFAASPGWSELLLGRSGVRCVPVRPSGRPTCS